MPTRLIREGWIDSLRIDQLDANAERFFLRLCLKADDFGRYHAHPTLLKSNLFPLRENARSTDMSRDLAACEKAGLVRTYEVSGARYLMIERFEQRSRAIKSKFPDPLEIAGQMPVNCQADASHPRTEAETYSDANANIGDGGGGGVCADARPPSAVNSEGQSADVRSQPPEPELVFPPQLNTPEFKAAWSEWQKIRQKGKKPKSSWNEYFAKQLAWLTTLGPSGALESVSHSARNEYQGLFDRRPGGGRNATRTMSFA